MTTSTFPDPGSTIFTNDSAAISDKNNSIPSVIGNYKIINLIPYTRAALAEPQRENDKVVIKCCRGGNSEQQILNLVHPNICAPIELLQKNDMTYVVYPYIDGFNMSVIAYENKMSNDWLRLFLDEMLDALIYLHGENLVHGDIKPSNIMLNRSGCHKLIDFETVRPICQNDSATYSHTPGFVPPNSKKNGTMSQPSTDLYALAATCHRILTGTVSKKSDPEQPTEYSSLANDDNLCVMYDGRLLASIDKALTADPAESWQSAEEWYKSIAPIIQDSQPLDCTSIFAKITTTKIRNIRTTIVFKKDSADFGGPKDDESKTIRVIPAAETYLDFEIGLPHYETLFTDFDEGSDFLAYNTQIGPYKITRVLDNKRFQNLYLAIDLITHEPVVLHEFYTHLLAHRNGPEVIARGGKYSKLYLKGLRDFVNDCRPRLGAEHPRLVNVTDVFCALNTAYYVTPYVRGTTLDNANLSNVDEEHIIYLLRNMLGALRALADKGSYHLGIEPSSILITEAGVPLLTHFGFKNVAYGTAIHVPGDDDTIVFPSSAYITEKQAFLKGDIRSDLFALGATMYYMITGSELPSFNVWKNGDVARLLDNPELQERFSTAFLQGVEKALDEMWNSPEEWLHELNNPGTRL